MRINVNQFSFRLTWPAVINLIFILFFVVYIGYDLEYNTAFVDEAIYANIGEEYLLGFTWENGLSWMGGSYLYPIISASINRILGLWGIRLFAMICTLITGILISDTARRLAGPRAATLTLGLFLFTSDTLNISQIATYDGPSLLFLSLALFTAWKTDTRSIRKQLLYTALSSSFLALAILSKYIGLLFIPGLGLFMLANAQNRWRNTFLWGLIIIAWIAPYVYINYPELYNYVTGDFSSQPSTRLEVLRHILSGLSVTVIGLILTLIQPKVTSKHRILLIILLFTGMAPLLYHLGTANIRSIWKHLVFANAFLIPVASLGIHRIISSINQSRINPNNTQVGANLTQLTGSIVSILLFFALWYNLSLHWSFQRSWPSTNATIQYLQQQQIGQDDRVFAEASAIYKYHLFNNFGNPNAWASTWYYQHDGQEGVAAMESAIADKTFRYVILNDYFTKSTNEQLLDELQANYQVSNIETYKLSGVYDSTTVVWERKPDSFYGFADLFIPVEQRSVLLTSTQP